MKTTEKWIKNIKKGNLKNSPFLFVRTEVH